MTDLLEAAHANGQAHIARQLSRFEGERTGEGVRVRVLVKHQGHLPKPGDLLRVASELLPDET